jgi:hypothetical protein
MSVLSSQLPRLTKITTNKDINMEENIIQYLQEHKSPGLRLGKTEKADLE